MLRIGVLASHTGSNFQAVVDACTDGQLDASVVQLVSNNSNSKVMTRAIKSGIPAAHLSSKSYPEFSDLDRAICDTMTSAEVDLILLAGYMKKLGPRVLEEYEDRIINVHPSLLPKYGGQGFYGLRVHEAVLASGDSETGASVHLVNGEYDTGRILAQRSLRVEPGDTAEALSDRVHRLEYELLIDVIGQFATENATENTVEEKS